MNGQFIAKNNYDRYFGAGTVFVGAGAGGGANAAGELLTIKITFYCDPH